MSWPKAVRGSLSRTTNPFTHTLPKAHRRRRLRQRQIVQSVRMHVVTSLLLAAHALGRATSAMALPRSTSSSSNLIPFDDWGHLRVVLHNVSIHLRYAGSGPPLLLVHGNPQHSLTWRTVGPLLAQKYTVIAPDNRGAGDSSIPPDGDYTAAASASASDLRGVLDFLNISSTYVVSHDKGAGYAVALAAAHPARVRRLVVSEYLLPGFGYEQAAVPGPFLDLYGNWQLAFFGMPDAAAFFTRGRERELLSWYFYHCSYSGTSSVPGPVLDAYADSISKPGFLRAMFGPFDNGVVGADARFFNSTLGRAPSAVPTLALGGESCLGPAAKSIFSPVFSDLQADVVPHAGHWIADENPTWLARRVARFLADDPSPLSPIDLSGLADRITTNVGYFGTYRNMALATQP
ncbi:hypothetical protein RB593_008366 [Gaeumannomyces tritici]